MNKKQKLRRIADQLWYACCFKKYGSYCEICGALAQYAHHFYYKGSVGHLRYDLDNGVILSRNHHFLLHHHDPKLIDIQILQKRGKKWFDKLEKKVRQKPKSGYLTITYYEKKIEELKKFLFKK